MGRGMPDQGHEGVAPGTVQIRGLPIDPLINHGPRSNGRPISAQAHNTLRTLIDDALPNIRNMSSSFHEKEMSFHEGHRAGQGEI
ncbi:hypothetical protein D3C85_1531000 [compost metagenome]